MKRFSFVAEECIMPFEPTVCDTSHALDKVIAVIFYGNMDSMQNLSSQVKTGLREC